MNLIFDTHAHYDDEAFDPDREALLASMPENGVGLIVDPGCDLDTSRRAVEIAEQYPHVYAAVGWHPENCAPYTRESLDTLRAWAKNPKVVAIGEIGLDYYWEQNPPREFQQEVFRDQLALAQELGLPVIVHDRDAHADCLAIVKEFPQVRGVFHCFSGSAEIAQELITRGWYLGFDGPLTYKNAKKTVEVAAGVDDQPHAVFGHGGEQFLAVSVERLVIVVGVGIKNQIHAFSCSKMRSYSRIAPYNVCCTGRKPTYRQPSAAARSMMFWYSGSIEYLASMGDALAATFT